MFLWIDDCNTPEKRVPASPDAVKIPLRLASSAPCASACRKRWVRGSATGLGIPRAKDVVCADKTASLKEALEEPDSVDLGDGRDAVRAQC